MTGPCAVNELSGPVIPGNKHDALIRCYGKPLSAGRQNLTAKVDPRTERIKYL